MKKQHNFFLKTEDKENIFYSTNFEPGKEKGSVLVFNYGLVCSNFHWEKQIEFFERQGHSILIHDYRGHYQSSGSECLEKITFPRIAKDLHLIIRELKLKDCTILGHSMGVNVCLEFAKSYPDIIKKMVLISGTVFPVQNILMNSHLSGIAIPILEKMRESFPKEADTFWRFGGWASPIKSMVRSGGFNTKQVDMDFIETYLSKLGELGPELFLHLVNQMQAHDALAFIDQIKTKTLVIGGNRDKVIPNFSQRMIVDSLDNGELYLIHTGSHVPQVDFPEIINERILEFTSN